MGASITHSSGVIVPMAMTQWSSSAEARTIMHPILGRPDDDVTFRPASLRRGSLHLQFADEVSAYAARAALLVPQRLSLTHSAVSVVAMTFVVADGEIGDVLADTGKWTLDVGFREVTP